MRLTQPRSKPIGVKESLENIDALQSELASIEQGEQSPEIKIRAAEIASEVEAWTSELQAARANETAILSFVAQHK